MKMPRSGVKGYNIFSAVWVYSNLLPDSRKTDASLIFILIDCDVRNLSFNEALETILTII